MAIWLHKFFAGLGTSYKKPVGAMPTVRLLYASVRGAVSERDVFPYEKSLTREGFHAWCSRRGDNHWFEFSGIQQITHLPSSKVLSVQEFQRQLKAGELGENQALKA